MRRMHAKKFNYEEEIDGPLYRETVRLFNEAAATGLAEGNIPLEGSHLERFVQQVRHNNEVFSAFRVHAMQQDLAANMIDEKGNLRPFKEWVEKSRPNLSHYNKEWLRTEYDTAVIRAHRAADWMQFEAEKDVLPNLRWMPTTSPNADALHRQFWERKLTLPVDHPFWSKHKPGDRWNCKCHLEATDDPASEIKEGEFAPAPAQPGLKGNPAKDGKIFSQDHPYFAKSCATCPFGKKAKGIKAVLNRWFMVSEKDCYDCQSLDDSVTQKNENKFYNARRTIERTLNKYENRNIVTVTELDSKLLFRGKKTLNNLIRHTFNLDELRAAMIAWRKPEKLHFEEPSAFGSVKDMNNPEDVKNLQRKAERGVIGYNKYSIEVRGETFYIKTEITDRGYEQFYAVVK